jgi:hypothetical protein
VYGNLVLGAEQQLHELICLFERALFPPQKPTQTPFADAYADPFVGASEIVRERVGVSEVVCISVSVRLRRKRKLFEREKSGSCGPARRR